jgi:type IV secretion system protein VirB10
VSRINRKVLIIGAGLGLLGLFAAMTVAFNPPQLTEQGEPRELYAQRSTVPERLSALPATYADIAPDVPELGPALPGEFGATLLQAERDAGLDPPILPYTGEPFRPDPQADELRAERLRQAQLTREANEAPVFFSLSSSASPGQGAPAAASRSGFDPADLNQQLSAFSALSLGATAEDPNGQARKREFAGEANTDIYNPHRIENPLSPFQLMAGDVIPASLVTAVNSDLPGTTVAQVTRNVYDTVSGQYLLIPQGSRLVGRYDSGVTFGQDRALLVWDRLIFPNGRSILIGGLAGSDATGASGLRDRVDHHWDRVFAAAGLATVLGVSAELAIDDDADEVGEAVRDAFQDTAGRSGDRIVQRQLGVQPTIRIRAGFPVRVLVTRDLILEPYDQTGGRP